MDPQEQTPEDLQPHSWNMANGHDSLRDSAQNYSQRAQPALSSSLGLAAAYNTNTKLFIGQIPPSCSTAMLTKIFSVFGNVVELVLLRDKNTQHHKGSAFCVFDSAESAMKAVAELHDRYRLEGARRNLVVTIARSPERIVSATQAVKTKSLFVGTLAPSIKYVFQFSVLSLFPTRPSLFSG